MGMLGSVVLLILGALASDATVGKRLPNARFWLQALAPLSGFIGIGAAINGLLCVFKMLAYLGFIKHAPVVYLANLGAGALSLLLGLRFGYTTAISWAGKHLSQGQRQLLDRLHTLLCTQEGTLGSAALVVGTFCMLLNLIT